MEFTAEFLDLEFESLMQKAGFDPDEEFAFAEKDQRLKDFPTSAYRLAHGTKSEEEIDIHCVRFPNRTFADGNNIVSELAKDDLRPAWPAEVLSMWATFVPTDDDIQLMQMSMIKWPVPIVTLGQTCTDPSDRKRRVLLLGYGRSPRGRREKLMGRLLYDSPFDYITSGGFPEWLWYAAVKNKK